MKIIMIKKLMKIKKYKNLQEVEKRNNEQFRFYINIIFYLYIKYI